VLLLLLLLFLLLQLLPTALEEVRRSSVVRKRLPRPLLSA